MFQIILLSFLNIRVTQQLLPAIVTEALGMAIHQINTRSTNMHQVESTISLEQEPVEHLRFHHVVAIDKGYVLATSLLDAKVAGNAWP